MLLMHNMNHTLKELNVFFSDIFDTQFFKTHTQRIKKKCRQKTLLYFFSNNKQYQCKLTCINES